MAKEFMHGQLLKDESTVCIWSCNFKHGSVLGPPLLLHGMMYQLLPKVLVPAINMHINFVLDDTVIVIEALF